MWLMPVSFSFVTIPCAFFRVIVAAFVQTKLGAIESSVLPGQRSLVSDPQEMLASSLATLPSGASEAARIAALQDEVCTPALLAAHFPSVQLPTTHSISSFSTLHTAKGLRE